MKVPFVIALVTIGASLSVSSNQSHQSVSNLANSKSERLESSSPGPNTDTSLVSHLSQDDTAPQDTRPFMRAKLTYSQRIVEGLAVENYELIAKSAQDLNLLSHESTWNVFQTPEYIKMSRDFGESTIRLRDAAREENLDGATLAYFEVTLSCVRCHRETRAGGDR